MEHQEITLERLSAGCGLENAVLAKAAEIVEERLMPADPYETYVEDMAYWLRFFTKYSIDDDMNYYVELMAKAFLCFLKGMFGDDIEDNITEANYETFSECLRVDVPCIWMKELNGGLVGFREFLKHNS